MEWLIIKDSENNIRGEVYIDKKSIQLLDRDMGKKYRIELEPLYLLGNSFHILLDHLLKHKENEFKS